MRAQSAIEYLTTYGWAILILAIVLFVIFQSGLLSPQKPTFCATSGDFSCSQYSLSASTGKLTINLQQITDSPIAITAVGCNNNGAISNMQKVYNPTAIAHFFPITITNSQSSPTPAPFQQIINITESNYSSYLTYNGNIANFEYFYANGTVIPAWIESNSSGKLITWLKLAKGIPANSKITIYLGFANKTTNLLSSSGTTGIGEAPQLSSTYAEYDDGASVFNFYDSFAGTTLPGWINYSVQSSSMYIDANNGLYIDPNGNTGITQDIYYNTKFTTPFILEADIVSIFNNGGTPSIGMSEGDSNSISSADLLEEGYGFSFFTANGIGLRYTTSGGSFSSVGSLPYLSTPTIIGLSWNATGNENAFYNYKNVLHSTNNTVSLTSSLYIGFGFNSGYYYTKGEFQWVRIRSLPPNGVMPGVSFASQYKYYVVVKDSATTPRSATSTTGTYTVT